MSWFRKYKQNWQKWFILGKSFQWKREISSCFAFNVLEFPQDTETCQCNLSGAPHEISSFKEKEQTKMIGASSEISSYIYVAASD